ncbi:MAG: ATP-binding protein [Candidatus Omnitrophica bacterium]|nr:ATP-binding protein [Candidatus Omnitrophota bacterium]
MKIKNFKLKLLLSYLFVILISFGFMAFFLDKNLEENSLQNIKSSLIAQGLLIENQISQDSLQKADVASLEPLAKSLALKAKCRITIIDTQGKVLADSDKQEIEISVMENHLTRPEVKMALNGSIGIDTRYSPTLKINMFYIALPLKEKNKITGVLRLALTLESVQETLFAIRKTVFLGLLFALVLAFILGSIVANMVVGPINRMIQMSRKFSEGDFSRRVTGFANDEIGELAVTLNQMAEDIENKIREIKTQNQKFSAIFNSMIEGVIITDKTGYIVSVNPAIEKIFAVSKIDAEGKLFLEAIRNNDIAETISNTLENGKSLSKELVLIYPVRRIFEANAVPIFDNKEISGCLVVIHDITEIRRLETVRQDFVANVSHELKTPLTSIKGFVETLLEGALDDKENSRSFLKIIQDHTERLNSLVDDLLSLSCFESKEATIDRESLNLQKLLEVILSGFKSQLKKKGIEVKNELTGSVTINADKNKIEHLFINLIDNAIKFNKENGTIRIYTEELDGKIKIIIEDSGAGIPAKDIPRIFERFYRVDKARSRELGGTGLGLSIVKHIVELHKGSAGVESIEGLGSKFWFILPK